MKHIDLDYTFVKELVHEGRIKLVYIKTREMLADIFTKVLQIPQFEYLRDLVLGISSANFVI